MVVFPGKTDQQILNDLDSQSKQLVLQTWKVMEPQADRHGINLFAEIFRFAPQVLSLFSFKDEVPIKESAGLRKHAGNFMRTLGHAITQVASTDNTVKYLRELSARHAQYGVEPEDLDMVGGALLHAVEVGLGKQCTVEVKEAWRKTWAAFQGIMEPALVAAKSTVGIGENLEDLMVNYIDPPAMRVVQHSWISVQKQKQDYGVRMFLHFFRLMPSVVPLFSFKDDQPLDESIMLQAHAGRFMNKIGFIVGRIESDRVAIPYIQELAVTHSKLGVKSEHFVFLGKGLILSLKEGFGAAWNPELEESWKKFWGTLEGIMKPILNNLPSQTPKKSSTQSPALNGTPPITNGAGPTGTPPQNGRETVAPPTPREHQTSPKKAPQASQQSSLKFHFVATCQLYALEGAAFKHVNLPGSYGPEGSLGVVILSAGATARQLLVYDKAKTPILRVEISASQENITLVRDIRHAFRVSHEGRAWKVALKSQQDEEKFIAQLTEARRWLWEFQEPFMVSVNLALGQNDVATEGDVVKISYRVSKEGEQIGSVGSVLEDTISTKEDLEFRVGYRQVTEALDEAVLGMQPGTMRRVVVPAHMTKGGRGFRNGSIAGQILYIDIVCNSVRTPQPGEPGLIQSRLNEEAQNLQHSTPNGHSLENISTPKSQTSINHTAQPNTQQSPSAHQQNGHNSTPPVQSPKPAAFDFAGTCKLQKHNGHHFEQLTSAEFFKNGQLGVVIMPHENGLKRILVYDKKKTMVMQVVIQSEGGIQLDSELESAILIRDEEHSLWRLSFEKPADHLKFCTAVTLARSLGWNQSEQAMIQQDIVLGNGATAEAKDTVVLRFNGWLEGEQGRGTVGNLFDSNTSPDQAPLVLRLGEGKGIWALEEGVVGMKAGGTRRLVVPPLLGYGTAGLDGKVPSDSVLHFEITLEDVQKAVTSEVIREAPHQLEKLGHGTQYSDHPHNHIMDSMITQDGAYKDSPKVAVVAQEGVLHDSKSHDKHDETSHDHHGMHSPHFHSREGSAAHREIASYDPPPIPFAGVAKLYKKTENGPVLVEQPGIGYGQGNSLGVVVTTNEDGSKSLMIYSPLVQAEVATAAEQVVPLDHVEGLSATIIKVRDDFGGLWNFRLKDESHLPDFLHHTHHEKCDSMADNSDPGLDKGNYHDDDDLHDYPESPLQGRPYQGMLTPEGAVTPAGESDT